MSRKLSLCKPLCSLCLRGEQRRLLHHRGTEHRGSTEKSTLIPLSLPDLAL